MINIWPILKSIRDEPEKWEDSYYTLDNKITGTKIWTANWLPCYELYHPKRVSFNIVEKIFFSFYFNRWKIIRLWKNLKESYTPKTKEIKEKEKKQTKEFWNKLV